SATIGNLRVYSVYAPNGQAVGLPAYKYKLEWYVRLRDCLTKEKDVDLVVCGDFNVAPEDVDVHDPQLWRGAIMCSDGERAAFQQLCGIGLRDTLRLHAQELGGFTWWDYRMLAFPKNRGLRIDAVLVNESLAKKCTASGVDREMRQGKDPSDHAPIWAEFKLCMRRDFTMKIPPRVRNPPTKPLIIWDGECHFCRRWIERWREITRDAVDYATSQESAERFPEIPREQFERSVIYIETDGSVFLGAEAVFRSLRCRSSRKWLAWSYDHVPSFAAV